VYCEQTYSQQKGPLYSSLRCDVLWTNVQPTKGTTVFVIALWCIVNKRTANKKDHCIRHYVMVYCEQTYSQQKGQLYSSLCCGVMWTNVQPTKGTTAFVIVLWCIVNKRTTNKRDQCIVNRRTTNKRDHCIRHCVMVYCEQTYNQQTGPLYSSLCYGVLWTNVQPTKETTVFVIVLLCIVNKRTANKRDHCIRHCVVVYCEQTYSQQKGPLYSSLCCGVLWTNVRQTKGTTAFVIALWCIVNKRTANKRDHCIRHCVVVYCEQTYSQQKRPRYSSLRCGVLWTIVQPTKGPLYSSLRCNV